MLAISWILLFSSFSLLQAITLKTGFGLIEGNERSWKTTNGNKTLYSFKKIPFARPPIGKYRFTMAEYPDKWEGVLNAKEYGPACPQNSTTSTYHPEWIDEDCLHVNIFTSEACLKSKDCPMVSYVHGGGFVFDSVVMFDDEYLFRNFAANDIVLVLPAFRLGFFGVLALPNDHVVPRNLATYDYVHALNWIQREGNNFGGNTSDVTLFGHSMGGTLVSYFMFSKSIDPEKKLFKKGVAMSVSLQNIIDEDLSFEKSLEFIEKAHCLPKYDRYLKSDRAMEDAIECLRKVPASELLAIQRTMEENGFTVTGFFLFPPLFPAKSFQDFMHNPPSRPYLLGSTRHEFDTDFNLEYIPKLVYQLDLKNEKEVSEKFLYDTYNGKFGTNHSLSTQHIYFGVDTLANRMKETGADVYLYHYDMAKHSHHTDDLSYLMGVHKFELDENEKVLYVLYTRQFINFIKTGVPNSDWKPLTGDKENYYNVQVDIDNGVMPHNKLNYQKEYIDYWNKEIVQFDKEISEKKFKMLKHDLPMEGTSEIQETHTIFSIWNIIFLTVAVFLMFVLVRACRGDIPFVINERSPLNV